MMVLKNTFLFFFLIYNISYPILNSLIWHDQFQLQTWESQTGNYAYFCGGLGNKFN